MSGPRPVLVVLAVLALLLGATACGGDDKEPKAVTPSASASATPSGLPSGLPTGLPSDFPLTSDGPAAGIPSDFPDEVPLVDGPVSQPLGAGSGEEGKKGWVLEVRVDKSLEDCFAEAAAALVEAGFTQQPGEIVDGKNRQAQFTKPGYAVIISTSPADDGSCRLGYEVGQVAG